jgi:hypothetical protein
MAIDFPNSPSVNQEFTVGDTTWYWSGTVWNIKSSFQGFTPIIDGGLVDSNFGGVTSINAGGV